MKKLNVLHTQCACAFWADLRTNSSTEGRVYCSVRLETLNEIPVSLRIVPLMHRTEHNLQASLTRKNKTCSYAHRNIKARSRNHCCGGKAISTTYSECVSVAVIIKHAKRMRCIILSSVACPAVPYFYTLSHDRHDFGGKNYGT
jgi:hypothetical protein